MCKSTLQLINQSPVPFQTLQQPFRIVIPENSPMLHARATELLDLPEVASLRIQSLKHKVKSFQPHSVRGVYLTGLRMSENTLLNAILIPKVGIKVYCCFVNEL